MARTKSNEFDSIKDHILICATGLFAKKGFSNTNIIEIGQACQASKSRMYHYFPSKDSMLEEMLHTHVQELLQLVSALTERQGDPKETFEVFIRTHLEYYFEHSERHSVMIQDADNLTPDARKELKSAELKLVECLTSILQKLNAKRFSDRDVTFSNAMLIYGMLNWTYTWYKPSDRMSFEKLAAEATSLCLNGIL
ncbi:TetR/AcrR family transcriptional regulator [Orrella sp. NBD-18]|uniref:TetR/AcrR family transcriptional regulator n=1 Tax=Sheuella amnicola TaxID=2707330 RepID=A0A6B2QUP8_9BURK|nr:TetR/AcrR family transcriptional regulator [Sheuella amnicola]NDY81623.1 TetR/AcrR family transcriptional regulator [Sheuella amnicola]HBI83757.1 TetR/AcrR family transcriptional regulator [Alcaligenaceae bacterium]